MRKHLAEYGVVPEWGIALKTLTQDETGVHAELISKTGQVEHSTFDYLVGADGAKGRYLRHAKW